VSEEAISAIRTKAELARRLSRETRDPAAKAGLRELASLLDADADRLEIAARRPGAAEVRRD
jgi:C4-dicarboxylate-specific signal transduction histidine kinase